MLKYILVPLDGSALAERALPVAMRIARASNATVLLVRAVAVPITFGVMYEGRSLKWRLLRDEKEEAQRYLHTVAHSTPLENIRVETAVSVGQPAEVVVGAALSHRAELVVMTSHGRTGLGRWVLGSVANHVAHHSPAPVLILRGRQTLDTPEGMDGAHPPRVLVPLDGSPLAEAVLEPARALAHALSGPTAACLHLMSVVAPYTSMPRDVPATDLLQGASAYLEQVAQRIRELEGIDSLLVSWSVVAKGDIARAIVETAEGNEQAESDLERQYEEKGEDGRMDSRDEGAAFDLIAMATHGDSAVTRWALGSVTERVLHSASLPILIVRPLEVAIDAHNERLTDGE